MNKAKIEELLQSPYWIIDILPFQVPKDSPGQYFRIEKYFLQGKRLAEIKQKHIDLVLKLNCYRDLAIDEEVRSILLRSALPERCGPDIFILWSVKA